MDNESKLKIIIEAQNRAQKAFDEANSQLDQAQKKYSSVSDRIGAVGDKMKDVGGKMNTRLTLPIVAGAGIAIKAFSDLQETLSKIDVTFGDNSGTVKAWADNAIKSMGLAKQSALDAAALFGDMGAGMGQSRDEATKMSMSLTQLGADMASFKNVSFERAQTALAGVYTGETEALKSLGIVMTETNLQEFAASKNIKKKLADMTQAEKVQLRYNYVMEKSANAQGDFARTSDSIANKTRMTKERAKELSAEFGEKLAPVMNKLLEIGNKVLDFFGGLNDQQQKTVLIIAGVVAGLGPLLTILGNVTTVVGGFIKVAGAMNTGLQSLGISVGTLGAVGLFALAGSFLSANSSAARFNERMQKLGFDTTVLKSTFDVTKISQDLLRQSTDMVKAAQDNLTSSSNNLANAQLGVEAANLRVEQAQKNYNQAVRRYGPDSLEARQANLDLKQAQQGVKDAADQAREAVKRKEEAESKYAEKRDLERATINATNALKDQDSWLNRVYEKANRKPVPGTLYYDLAKSQKLPGFASGVRNFGGGMAVVGERGPELVNLPRGADVFSNVESKNIVKNATRREVSSTGSPAIGSMTNNFNIYNETDVSRVARDIGFQIARAS